VKDTNQVKGEGRFGIERQTITNIKVLLEELEKSGIVNMIERRP
jgi:hypothetical protein